MKTEKLKYFWEVVDKFINQGSMKTNISQKKLEARIMKMKLAGWSSGPTGTAEKQGAPIAWYGDSLNKSFVRLE